MTRDNARHIGTAVTIVVVAILGKVFQQSGDAVLNAVLLLGLVYLIGIAARVPQTSGKEETGDGQSGSHAEVSTADEGEITVVPRGQLASGRTARDSTWHSGPPPSVDVSEYVDLVIKDRPRNP